VRSPLSRESTSPTRVRYFFALWPPAETARALETWAKMLEGRVTPADKIHLTLAFLGTVAPQKAIGAARRVQGRPHELPLEKAQYWKHNRIVWAGPREVPPELKMLVQTLHLELFRAEYILERRPFAAHVTLLRSAQAPAELAPLPEVEWPVRELTLVQSANSAKGSVYEVVERFALG
jgi:RNA 2',3'-cyclic 3'-phosphodiesterase